MKNFCKQLFLSLVFLFFFNFTFSQSGNINVKFIGNCGLYLTDSKSNVYIDFPYKSGAHSYMEYDKAELDSLKDNATFIFTHKHADHYSKKLLRKANGKKYGPWNIESVKKIEETIPDFSIESFRTKHKVFGISFEHYSYLIVWHKQRIFISGDTESCDTVASIKNIDFLFAPAWLLSDAIDKSIKIDAEKFVIYHIGPKDSISSTNPKIQLLNKSGQRITIPFE